MSFQGFYYDFIMILEGFYYAGTSWDLLAGTS